MANTKGAINLENLSEREQEEVRKIAGATADKPTVRKVRTAFLVIIEEDGNVQATPDVAFPLALSAPATPRDIKYGCSEVKDVITQSEIAGRTQQLMMQTAQLMQQAEQERRIREQLGV